jgi:hypothetical protein
VLALTQIDGIVADFDDTGAPFLLAATRGAEATRQPCGRGHPRRNPDGGLSDLVVPTTENVRVTQATGDRLRHGILHGRELAYGTLRNSTWALATLLAVIEWAQPRARARLDAAEAERSARYVGTKEVDERGRRHDRAGFAAAKQALLNVPVWQRKRHEELGRFVDSLTKLNPSAVIFEVHADCM